MAVLKCFMLLLLFPAITVQAAMSPLVDGNWVLEHLRDDDVLFLDIQPAAQYRSYHIPGAINSPYPEWRTGKKNPPKGMLPPIAELEKKIGELGISETKKVIVVSTGNDASDMAAAARVFWTLQLLGHTNNAILDGGLIAYARARGKLEKGENQPSAVIFKARPNMVLLAEIKDVKRALKDESTLVDSRSPAEFLGIYQASREQQPGTIPGAKNLPFDWLTINGSGQINETKNLRRLFDLNGIKESGEHIHFCQSGNRASLNWFVDYALLGNRKARLYDGSANEWANRKNLPVENKAHIW